MPERILRVPHKQSFWVWELGQNRAREIIEVTEVRFNGDEWWVTTLTHPTAPRRMMGELADQRTDYNELERFWEAVTPIGGRIEDLSNPITPAQYKQQLTTQEEL